MEHYEVQLRILHRQCEGEEILSEGEMHAKGELIRVPSGWQLCYREPAQQDAAETLVELALFEGEVQLRRFGEASSEACFREGVENTMRYQVAGHALELQVLPQRVCWSIAPGGGTIRLTYWLSMGDAGCLQHSLAMELTELRRLEMPTEGEGLRAEAWRALCCMLGDHWGFVRWADREEALLVTDACRAARRVGIDSGRVRRWLELSGWRVEEAAGLWWLDPPEEAFRAALRMTSQEVQGEPAESAQWQDGVLGELQAACGILLRAAPETLGDTIAEDVRGLMRGAWKHMEGPPGQVQAWLGKCMKHFAVARRKGMAAGEYACGVWLQRYLRGLGCEVPPAESSD